MKRSHIELIFFSLIVLTLNFRAGAQKLLPSNLKRIVALTDSLQNRLSVEKVYLQTDKHNYYIGDTIWFKGYVLDGAYLSASQKSGLLFVELHDDNSEVIRRITVPINAGLTYTQIPLIKDIFHEGGYTLRAYTNWMKNFGVDYVFTKRFYLGLPKEKSWIVNSLAKINGMGDKQRLQIDIKLKDASLMPVGLHKVEVMIIEAGRVLEKKELETTLEGSLSIQSNLKNKMDVRNMWVEIRGLSKNDDDQSLKIPLNISRLDKIDLQFLPEGGSLVAGLKSVVAFKAVAENGNGIDVSGDIYDSKNKIICSFKSLHKGMGAFEFIPKSNEIYKARLRNFETELNPFDLPVVNNIGTTLHISNQEMQDSLDIRIDSKLDSTSSTGVFYLIGSSRGIVCFAKTVDVRESKIKVPKSLFPSGIARFTLMKGVTPLNERVTFIDHRDTFGISFNANKAKYGRRDSISIEIIVRDKKGEPVKGSFSLAVTDDNQIKADSMNNFSIVTSIFLNSELKGTVEEPGFYLDKLNKVSWQALDQLMLTQGWKGFSWKDVFNQHHQPKFAADLSNQNKREVSHMTFPEIRPEIIQPWYVNVDNTQRNYINNIVKQFDYERTANGNLLKEVEITSKKRNYNAFNLNGFGQADIVLDSSDIKKSATTGLYQLLKQKIPDLKIAQEYLRVENRKGYSLKIRDRWLRFRFDASMNSLFLGETPQGLKDRLNEFKVSNLSSIEVMYTQKYLWKYYPPTPAKPFVPGERAQIFKANAQNHLPTPPPTGEEKLYAIVQITYAKKTLNSDYSSVSFIKPQLFYSPKYNNPRIIEQPDLRSTIYWNPNIITDENGKAKISFYSADSSGSYSVYLEGSDLQGGIGTGKYKLQVASVPDEK